MKNENTPDNLSPSIGFVLNSNLSIGAGTEKTLIHYLKYKLENIKNIYLFQTPILEKSIIRVKEQDLNDLYKTIKIIYISPIDLKILRIILKLPNFLKYLIYYPSLFLSKHIFYRNLNKKYDSFIIYLFKNDFAFFFKRNVFLIGSLHTWAPPNKFTSKIISRITEIIFRNKIKIYHSFPIYTEKLKELFPNKKVISLPNGVESDNFRPIIHNNQKIIFLFVAQIEECKGIFRLIDVWMDFKDLENVELNIVRSGSAIEEMQKRISGIKNINYLGIVPENQLYEIYGKSDVFIYPSSCDTFGLVVLEALSSGLFVITTDLFKGIFPEFEKANAFYFCSNDKKCFSDGIKYAINNIETIRSKKELLHNIAKEYYDWKIVVKKLYDEMIKAYYEYKQTSK